MTAVAEAETVALAPTPPAPTPPASGVPRTGAPPTGRRELIVLLIGSLALAAAVIGTRWGVFTPDTRPDLYQNPAAFLRSSVQAWVDGSSGLGQGNFNAGAAPVAAVVWVIRALGASPWLAVRIWRLLVLLVGAWGIRRYLGALMGRRLSVQARILATVFWVINPYVIVAGSTTPILLPYALLPWTMLAFLHATRSPRSWRWPAVFALAFFAQTGLNAGVVPFFQLAALPAHLVHARWVERRSWRDLMRVVIRCGALSMVVSLYWLLPSFLASSTGAGIASGTENPVDVARTSSYAETARLLGNWPLYGRSGNRTFLGSYTVYLTSLPVLLATMLVPLAVGLSLWLTKARERLLVVVLLFTGLPIMVGLFPPDDPYPAGSALAAIFEKVPAALAFRTTNKVGAVVVLAETIALVFGWRAWQMRVRSNRSGRGLRVAAGAVVVALLVGISAPLWNGGLYPLGYKIPGYWEQATSDLDAADPDGRVLVVPGGTGGNYRWGMRSPDDLFPSLLDRPVAVRNTVVGRGDPAGNFLSTFDVTLAQGALADRSISTTARYLGASDVLVRSDLLTEEIGGPEPWVVDRQASADPGLTPNRAYGRLGENTVPGRSGRATKSAVRSDPANAALRPLQVFDVVDPIGAVRAGAASDQVLLVGDGEAVAPLAGLGIVDGTQPIRYLGDLDQASFAKAVRLGGRIVLTDTNRRRAWDINRTANATSQTLTSSDDIDSGNGSTVTLWPDHPADQSVAQISGGVRIDADRPGFGLHPYGRPSNAFDGDPTTSWVTGGFGTGVGDSISITYPKPRRIDSITILPDPQSKPGRITAVSVSVDNRRVIEAVESVTVPTTVSFEPSIASRVKVTILAKTSGENPLGISEISVDGDTHRNVTRLPHTLTDLTAEASAATKARVAAMDLDVVLNRARGSVFDPYDDEEAQLDRRFELPDDRTFRFSAERPVDGANPLVVAAAKAGEATCTDVAALDGSLIRAKVVSTPSELDDGRLLLEGCDPVELGPGRHDLAAIFGWQLDSVRLSGLGGGASSPTVEREAGSDAGAVEVTDRTATRIEMDLSASADGGSRYVRLGEAFDERWTLAVDGADAGPPILVDGYSSGWLVDGKAHRLVARFGPQRAVQVTFVASAAGFVGVTALAVLPPPTLLRRRGVGRQRTAEPVAGGGPV